MSNPSRLLAEDVPQTTLLWEVGRVLCRFVLAVFFDVKIYGREHVPKKGGALLVSNHQSFLDPVLLAVRLKRPVSFFARSSLFENRWFGWLIRSLHAFPVHRGEADVGAMKEAIKRLREGCIVNVFPEGTRSTDGRLRPVLPGVALIVRRSHAAVVPAIITGAWRAWPRGRKLPVIFRPIRVRYGPPLNTAGLDDRQIVKLIDQTFVRMMNEQLPIPHSSATG